MSIIYGPYSAGSIQLEPGKTTTLFWDVSEGLPEDSCTWMVTAVPRAVNPEFEPVPPEQRVEVVDVFFLRKGPDSTKPNQLQLNYTIRNNGKNSVNANINICAIGP